MLFGALALFRLICSEHEGTSLVLAITGHATRPSRIIVYADIHYIIPCTTVSIKITAADNRHLLGPLFHFPQQRIARRGNGQVHLKRHHGVGRRFNKLAVSIADLAGDKLYRRAVRC